MPVQSTAPPLCQRFYSSLLPCAIARSCSGTCDSTRDAYTCGDAGFECKDANATDFGQCPLYNPDQRARVGNGICDLTGASVAQRLDTASCDWDGGDWCVEWVGGWIDALAVHMHARG